MERPISHMDSVGHAESCEFLRSAVLLSRGETNRDSQRMAMADPDHLLQMPAEVWADGDNDSWQGGSYHAFNLAYEDLKHRYNDLQEKYRLCLRQLRGKSAGSEDEAQFLKDLKESQVPPGVMSENYPDTPGGDFLKSKGTDTMSSMLERLNEKLAAREKDLATRDRELAARDRELAELRKESGSRRDLEERVKELQEQNDQLMKLNHDLTYDHSDQVVKQLQEKNRLLEMTMAEVDIWKKDYNVLLQENETLTKKNVYLKRKSRTKNPVPENSSLTNGGLDNDHSILDGDDLLQMVGMSLSSRDEMIKLKETVWKLNEVIRILLRQQRETSGSSKSHGYGINGDVSMPMGLGARPKVRQMALIPNTVRPLEDLEDSIASEGLKVKRSQSMQNRKKPKNLDLKSKGYDSQLPAKHKTDIEYMRAHVDTEEGVGHIKYTTNIKLHEDILESELPKDRSKKNEKQGKTRRQVIDPRGAVKEGRVSPFGSGDLPRDELQIAATKVDRNNLLGDLAVLPDVAPIPKALSRLLDDPDDTSSADNDDFLTLTPEETQQFEPAAPVSSGTSSLEARNNRRSSGTPGGHSRQTGGVVPRPLNIDRNECDQSVRRSYDNTLGLNVNLNTSKDKFDESRGHRGFSILNNDPLTGNKTIPSKNIFREQDPHNLPHGPPPSVLQRRPQEHEDAPLQTCPVCAETFESTVSPSDFESHVEECIAQSNGEEDNSLVLEEREERMCPMCNKVFSDSVSQSDFEVHVNDHFELTFEVVSSSEA